MRQPKDERCDKHDPGCTRLGQEEKRDGQSAKHKFFTRRSNDQVAVTHPTIPHTFFESARAPAPPLAVDDDRLVKRATKENRDQPENFENIKKTDGPNSKQAEHFKGWGVSIDSQEVDGNYGAGETGKSNGSHPSSDDGWCIAGGDGAGAKGWREIEWRYVEKCEECGTDESCTF